MAGRGGGLGARDRQEGRQTNGPSLSFLIFNICLKISARSTRPLLPNLNTAEIHCRTAGSWCSSAFVPAGPVLLAARSLLPPPPARALIVSPCLLLHNYLPSLSLYFRYRRTIPFALFPTSPHSSKTHLSLSPIHFLWPLFAPCTRETPLFTLSLIASHYAVSCPIVSHAILVSRAPRSARRTRRRPARADASTDVQPLLFTAAPLARLGDGARREAEYYLHVREACLYMDTRASIMSV